MDAPVTRDMRVASDARLAEAVVGNLKLFSGAPTSLRTGVAAQCWTLPLARGVTLTRRGERLPGIGAVAYGAVKLRIQVSGARERVVRVVTAGQSFGESAALLGAPSPFDPVALASSKLVIIPPAAVLSAIERDAHVARNAVALLAERHLQVLEELHTTAPRRGLQRLASYLDSVAEPVAGNGALRARLPGTKTLAAAQLGMSKETLSRLLRALATRGLVRLTRREIDILDRDALAALAARPDAPA